MTDTEITVDEDLIIEALALLKATSSLIADLPQFISYHDYLASMTDDLSEFIFGEDYVSLSEIDLRATDIEAEASADIERMAHLAIQLAENTAAMAALN